MATCLEWQDFFKEFLRYTRGIGDTAPVAPDGLPPEGCDLSPCGDVFSVAVAIQSLRTQLESRDNLNANLPPGCPPKAVRAVRQFSGGNITPGWQVFAPAGGQCGAFTQTSFFGQMLDCDPGLPPAPPEPPIYSEPISFLVQPLEGGGWTVTSETNVWPSAEYFQGAIENYQCICDNLFKIFKIIQQQHPTAYFEQTNRIGDAQVLRAGFNMLAKVIQLAVADATGKEARLVESEVIQYPGVSDVVLPNP